MLEPLRDDRIRAGREALRRSAWAEARDAFEAAVGSEETPEALEGLAAALRLTDDAGASLALRERAFRLRAKASAASSQARRASSKRPAAAAATSSSSFMPSGNPYEAARSRLDQAEALLALGRDEDARREARAALDAFSRLGAVAAEKRARALLQRASPPAGDEPRPDGLSRRQCEVLRLLARGLSNREIGERLFVSEFTVKRHVADILTRLDFPSRAAAAAYAAQQGLV